jgi:hypothetical protein
MTTNVNGSASNGLSEDRGGAFFLSTVQPSDGNFNVLLSAILARRPPTFLMARPKIIHVKMDLMEPLK